MPERAKQHYLTKVALIAWREFRFTALTKGFIFGAVAMPVLMFGVIALMPMLLSRESPPLVGTIVIADPSGTILPRARDILASPPSNVEVLQDLAENPPTDPAAQLDALSELGDTPTQRIEVEWRAEQSLDAIEPMKSELREGLILAGAAIPIASLDPSVEAKPFELYIRGASAAGFFGVGHKQCLFGLQLCDSCVHASLSVCG